MLHAKTKLSRSKELTAHSEIYSERAKLSETGLNFTGRSPAFSFLFKCPAEHLNKRGKSARHIQHKLIKAAKAFAVQVSDTTMKP